jgi:hypothetical protein
LLQPFEDKIILLDSSNELSLMKIVKNEPKELSSKVLKRCDLKEIKGVSIYSTEKDRIDIVILNGVGIIYHICIANL